MTDKKIGWIGTGIMGGAMANHLLEAGCNLAVFNRTKAKSKALLERGAKWLDSPEAIGANCDIVFVMVGYPKEVEDVILGENGCLKAMRQGAIVCDMTTSSPELARKIAANALEKGCAALDAPVTGGDVGARNATLSIFAGGDDSAIAKMSPYLELMSKAILYCGGPGTGQAAKLANQISVAGIMFSVCESLLFAEEEGLDAARWLEFVSTGVAQSQTMKKRGERMLRMDYEPGFYVEYFVKDLGLCLDECRRMHLRLPGTELAEHLYKKILEQGKGKYGTQILIAALAEMSGKEWRPVR